MTPSNPHEQGTPAPITGYRVIPEAEVALINRIKAKGDELGALVTELEQLPLTPRGGPVLEGHVDGEMLAIARAKLKLGIMALVRCVARPSTF